MKLSLWILGTEVFAISTGDEPAVDYDGPGDCLTTPIGFVQRHDVPDEAGMYYDWGVEDSLQSKG